jgi:hypothetical protein
VSDQTSGSAVQLSPETKPKKDDLFWVGIALTVLWLAIGIPLMFFWSDRTGAPKPNEWGDIFAGLAAPVAFLWLVLGFKQQGRELQLSTKALELQVAELKQSVEQQKELVGVTRDQFQANIDEQERRRVAELEAKKPRFVMHQIGTSTSGRGVTTYHFTLRNEGETATHLVLTVSPVSTDDVRFPELKRGDATEFVLHYERLTPPMSVAIDYDDIDGIPRRAYLLGEFEVGRGLLFRRTSPSTQVT